MWAYKDNEKHEFAGKTNFLDGLVLVIESTYHQN